MSQTFRLCAVCYQCSSILRPTQKKKRNQRWRIQRKNRNFTIMMENFASITTSYYFLFCLFSVIDDATLVSYLWFSFFVQQHQNLNVNRMLSITDLGLCIRPLNRTNQQHQCRLWCREWFHASSRCQRMGCHRRPSGTMSRGTKSHRRCCRSIYRWWWTTTRGKSDGFRRCFRHQCPMQEWTKG